MMRVIFKSLALALIFLQLSFISFPGSPADAKKQSIPVVRRAIYLIQHNYYDESRIKPKDMLESGFFELAQDVPEVLPKFVNDNLHFKLGPDAIVVSLKNVDHIYKALTPVSQVFSFIKNNYKGDKTLDEMEYAFVQGMLAVLDPHSRFFPPRDNKEFRTHTEGKYGGLGFVVGYEDFKLTIISPIEDTPADRAGVQAGDIILQIDDYSTLNMSITEAVDLMRGKPGTKITLKLKSKDGKVRETTMVREIIAIQSARTKLATAKNGKKIGLIRVKSFQKNTRAELLSELKKLKGQNIHGYVLDLRKNPGGIMQMAVDMADRFLSKGDIVSTVYAGQYEVDEAKNQMSDIKAPLVVIIDEGSASASEIVAGALKNNQRAIILGASSFGKGSVQQLYDVRNGASMKITVAEYLVPGNQSIQAVGITPDIHVYPSIITEDTYDLVENTYLKEGELDSHLESQNIKKAGDSFFEITYLRRQEKERQSQHIIKIKEDEDYELQLAIQLLSKVKSADLPHMIQVMTKELKAEQARQTERLAEVLKERSIDWSAGKSRNPNLKVSYRYLDVNQKPVQNLMAGNEYELEVMLSNTGSSPVYRTQANLESFNPLLNNREFVFGRVNPGKSSVQKIKIEVPHEITNFEEKSKLNVYVSNDFENPITFSVSSLFNEKVSPQLSYAYKIYDGNGCGSVGNKNGILDVNEKVCLEVTIKNLGPTVSEETLVNLRNQAGNSLFFEKARDTIGRIGVNESKTTHFTFRVQSFTDDHQYEMEIFTMDNLTQASLTDTIKLSSKSKSRFSPSQAQFQRSPRIELSKLSKREGDKYRLMGRVFDDIRLKDIAIFVAGKKLFYQNLEDQKVLNPSKNFELSLPLEEGLNYIIIKARGNRDLSAIKTLSIVYEAEDVVASKL